jgi:hypothetical protein
MITNEFPQPRNMRSNHATGKPSRQYIHCAMRPWSVEYSEAKMG